MLPRAEISLLSFCAIASCHSTLVTAVVATSCCWISARVGRWMLDGLLRSGRHGQRVPFEIPDSLGGLRR